MERNPEYVRQINQKKARALKKKKIRKTATYSFLVYLVASLVFYFELKSFNIIPDKFLTILRIAMIVVSIPLCFLALVKAVNSRYKKKQTAYCIFLAILLIVSSIAMPITKGQLAKIFVQIPTQGQANINLYVLSDSNFNKIEDLAGKNIGVQTKIDLSYQNDAIKEINKEIQSEDIITIDCKSLYDAIDRLYAKEIDGFILNESYESIITENDLYENFKSKTKVLYTSTPIIVSEEISSIDTSTIDLTSKPFVIAISGIDQWDEDSIKSSKTRSDVNIIAVVNPTSKKILLVSLPRDSYVMLNGKNQYDKLTHASYISIDCWCKTIENLLDVDIDKYIKVNFSTLVEVVDAMGGIDIDNPDSFDSNYYDSYDKNNDTVIKGTIHFNKGLIHLDGKSALTYCRERKHLDDGDMGRNRHQSLVLKACINKATSVSVIANASKLIKTLQGKFNSNLQMSEIYGLTKMQLDDMADWQIESVSIKGENDYDFCYVLQDDAAIVRLSNSQITNAKQLIKNVIYY